MNKVSAADPRSGKVFLDVPLKGAQGNAADLCGFRLREQRVRHRQIISLDTLPGQVENLLMKIKGCELEYEYKYYGHCDCGDPEARVCQPKPQAKVTPADIFRVRVCTHCAPKWEAEVKGRP